MALTASCIVVPDQMARVSRSQQVSLSSAWGDIVLPTRELLDRVGGLNGMSPDTGAQRILQKVRDIVSKYSDVQYSCNDEWAQNTKRVR